MPLAELVDWEALKLPELLELAAARPAPRSRRAAASSRRDASPSGISAAAAAAAAAPLRDALSSGMLDMSAFGGDSGGLPAAPAPEQQQQQPASGGFDLSAFGDFGGGAAAALEPEPVVQQAPLPAAAAAVADPMASGMLDLAAFGMGPPEPEQAAAPAADMGSGLLDLAAFGMALPAPPDLASGQLDLGAFGMGLPPPPPAPLPPPPPPAAQAAQPAEPVREEPLPPPPQRTVAAAALQPLPAGVAAQLRGLVESRDDEGEAAGFDDPFPSRFSQPGAGSSSAPGPGSPWGPCPREPIPGLSLPETSAVLALAGGLSPADAAGPGHGLRLRPGGAQLDEAAGQALLCLAVALSQRGDGGNEAAVGPAAGQAMAFSGIKNAAGVGFALPPSAAAAAGPAVAAAPQPLGQEWCLLPGLEAPAVLWGVLSGEIEQQAPPFARILLCCSPERASSGDSNAAPQHSFL